MRQHGRKSATSRLVTSLSDSPLEPPPTLGEREAVEWRAIVGRMGPDWFPRETHGLLEALCVVTTELRDFNTALGAFGPGLPEERNAWRRWKELVRLRGRAAMQMASLATKLRLTIQSRKHPNRAYAEAMRPAQPLPRPWNDDVLPPPRTNGRKREQ